MYELTERINSIEAIPQSENLQKAKTYFRDALGKDKTLGLDLKMKWLVNYGNCLDILGRGVEALYAYDEALKINRNFSMAIGNKAQALRLDLSLYNADGMHIKANLLRLFPHCYPVIFKIFA